MMKKSKYLWGVLGCALLATSTNALAQSTGGSSATQPVERFAQLPVGARVAMSPDGEKIAILKPVNGRYFAFIHHLATGKSHGIASPENGEVNDLYWAGNERLVVQFIYTKVFDGNVIATTRLLAMDTEASNALQVVKPGYGQDAAMGSMLSKGSNSQAKGQFEDIVGPVPDKPGHIYVGIDPKMEGHDIVIDADTSRVSNRSALPGNVAIQRWWTDHEGRRWYGKGWRNGDQKSIISDKDGGFADTDAAPWAKADFEFLGFAADPDLIYLTKKTEKGQTALYAYNQSAKGQPTLVFAPERGDVVDLAYHDPQQAPVGAVFEDGGRKVHYFDPQAEQLQKVIDKALPGTVNRVVTRAAGKPAFVVRADSGQDPGVLYYLDLSKKRMEEFSVIMPGLDPATMAKPREVRYPARDGLEIPGFLTLPAGKGEKNLPMVVLPHGGPAAHDAGDWDFVAQFLANRGYAVFQPNFRGSTGYGEDFHSAGLHQWGAKMQDDITDGVKWLEQQGIADSGRICVVGFSYGGYAALQGAVRTPEAYKCAASINGVSDLVALGYTMKQFIGGRQSAETLKHEDGSLADYSPSKRAEAIRAKVLLMASKDDSVVEPAQTDIMASALRSAGNPATVVEIDSGNHWMLSQQARQKVLTSLAAFLKANIGG